MKFVCGRSLRVYVGAMVFAAVVLAEAHVWGERTRPYIPAIAAPTATRPTVPAATGPSTQPATQPASQPATRPSTQPVRRPPSTRKLIGMDALFQMCKGGPLGVPQGRGVKVAHVEGPVGQYMPDVANRRFEQLIPRGKSGASQVSGHATSTSQIIYGRSGLAPGIVDVHFYASEHWLGAGYLNTGSPLPPVEDDRRLFTHSWIADSARLEADVLRRVDYLVDTREDLVVVGVNNGKSMVPALLGSAYNVIAVGNDSGNSSSGYTRVEGEGRCKPDVVAPGGLTSYATPAVAAVVARLLETADGMEDWPDARRAAVIRAVLLAGAQKLPGWKQEAGKPLDGRLGAGRVRVDQSYQILTAGPMSPVTLPGAGTYPPAEPGAAPNAHGGAGGLPGAGTYPPAEPGADPNAQGGAGVLPGIPGAGGTDSKRQMGWSFHALAGGGVDAYEFEVPSPGGEASIVLAWNRRVEGGLAKELMTGRVFWNNGARLADLDLFLYRLPADGEQGPVRRQVAQSSSRIDNVEHIYQPTLAAGRYRLEVVRLDPLAEDWTYGLAYRVTPPAGPGEGQESAQTQPVATGPRPSTQISK
ncbi:MAG: hypothetical protein IT443_09800 [Phycisphaeraceae bacterium]|nr:hypothetical protein [Phycisphaeraceae bacterium]